ncbi:transcriptional regulator, GntR family [Candidatus Moduliflexus flocculans]|uniref:Transcriptional regulator, GntR family n=1 Tax=Candidatus Moduliflexus flocculans TaxID=1499966 RepID=A0A0S6W4H0_9BACT|nr:transcriptional regulator, GntR family [Candidatus Moduliflexus flocculans]
MSPIKAFKSKKELVYEYLRKEILHGSFAPGARIVIDELAATLGVSQIPIREALQQLQSEGFVETELHVGPRVSEIRPELISEIFQLLEALEVISSKAACIRMTPADLNEMERILRRMDDLHEDTERWSQENERLHDWICERAGTTLVKNLMDNVLDQWDRLRHCYLKDVFAHRIDLAQKDHWELFYALRDRDPERVEQVMRQHNQRALAAYVGHLKAARQIA